MSLTVFDPDAPGGGFLHWRIAKLPASQRSLPTASKLGGPNGTGRPGWAARLVGTFKRG